MPDLASVEDFAAKIRQRRPDLGHVSDDNLVMKALGAAPELAPLVDIKPLHERTRAKAESLAAQAAQTFPEAPPATSWGDIKNLAGGAWETVTKTIPGIVSGLTAEPSPEERQRWGAQPGQPISGGAAAQRLFEMPGQAALGLLYPEGGPSVPLGERLGKTFLGEEVTEQAKTDPFGAGFRFAGQLGPWEALRLAGPAAKLTGKAAVAAGKATRILPLEKASAFETLQESLNPGAKVPGPIAATKEATAEIATAARESKIDVLKEGWDGFKKAAEKAADTTWAHIEDRLGPYWDHPAVLLDKAKVPELTEALNTIWTKAFQKLPTEAAEFNGIATKVLHDNPITFREAQTLLDPLDKKLLAFYEENPILRSIPELDPAATGVLRARNAIREAFSTEADKLVTEGGMGDAVRTWGNIKDAIGDALVQKRITEHWKSLPWSARRSMNIAQAYHATSAVTELSPRHGAIAAALSAAKRTPGANEALMQRAFRALKDEPSALKQFGARGPADATITGPLFPGHPGGLPFGPGGISPTQPVAGLLPPGPTISPTVATANVPPTAAAAPSSAAAPPPVPLGIEPPAGGASAEAIPPDLPPNAPAVAAPPLPLARGVTESAPHQVSPTGEPLTETFNKGLEVARQQGRLESEGERVSSQLEAVKAKRAERETAAGTIKREIERRERQLGPPAGVAERRAQLPTPKPVIVALPESIEALGEKVANDRAKLISKMSDTGLKNSLKIAQSEDFKAELNAAMSRRAQQLAADERPGFHREPIPDMRGEAAGFRWVPDKPPAAGTTPTPAPPPSAGVSPSGVLRAGPTPAASSVLLTLDSEAARVYGKSFADLQSKAKDVIIGSNRLYHDLVKQGLSQEEITKRIAQSYPTRISDKARAALLERAEKAAAKRASGEVTSRVTNLEAAEAGAARGGKPLGMAPSPEDVLVKQATYREGVDKIKVMHKAGDITLEQARMALKALKARLAE